ncbi:hypothetical protein G7B40_005315 [Aetokthonos hydrillicola Thurmond2011]|jgi:hypothetical protein|uniref:Uncharacterized protein n=1 Tax=Aetokthonos hydrillicola Thurmond2011 TaxID=2712845 RepID=A0AAP5I2P5_9CYAN|nr:hypothetical protein [Aetokthonos hydrillicola]MBO3457332.1 hypothetical protein [Aetokthonos hydrillicola CCALA 1050]MBW4586681.1 hypothetical protein [Aetokthonos hydrillicola CCALA 1050]MDR9893992.1 hypothetical protein [Aetokthonos hydrillicola Thurmond2011]
MTSLQTKSQTHKTLADPNQKYWDLGLKYFNDGDLAITAIQKLWRQMPPPASLPLLATIIGALYADTYWANTKMDVNLLAGNLQAGLGINPADCQKAANIAFSRWYGFLVRSNMGDSGSIPKPDPVTNSPDVVLNGDTTLPVDQLIEQWNTYIYTLKPGLKNNVYGRAQSVNIKVPQHPQLSMYYSDAGFNPPPSSWVKMFTDDGSATTPMQGIQPGSIGVGDRCANPQQFAFSPSGAGHYCLITVVSTEFFTNDPLVNPGNWNTQEWIHSNGAAGWHNVDVTQANHAVLKFYNQDGTSEQFVFEAHCRNLPIGTTVSLRCEHEDLPYSIQTPSVKIVQEYQVISTRAEVPPNFAADLHVQFDTPDGKCLPGESSIDVRMDWELSAAHQHYHQALNQLGDTNSGFLGSRVRIPMGNFTFVGSNG